MELFTSYAHFIDDLRRQKGIKIKELCDGIVNERTYRRYMNGERQLSQNKILMFCDKLGISMNDFYSSFQERDKFEYKRLYNLYSMLGRGEYTDFKRLLEEIDPKSLINNMSLRFYNYLGIRYRYEKKQITLYTAYDELTKLLGYPQNVNSSVFDFADIVILSTLSRLEVLINNSNYGCTELLKRILLDDSVRFLAIEAKNVLPTFYSLLSLAYGKRGDIASSIELAEKGVKHCLYYGQTASLTNLYFSLAFGKKKQNLLDEAHKYVVLCLANALSEQKDNYYNDYYKVFKRSFEVDPDTLFPIIFKNVREK